MAGVGYKLLLLSGTFDLWPNGSLGEEQHRKEAAYKANPANDQRRNANLMVHLHRERAVQEDRHGPTVIELLHAIVKRVRHAHVEQRDR